MHNWNNRAPKFMWKCLRRDSILHGEDCDAPGAAESWRHRTAGFYLMRLRANYHRETRKRAFARPADMAAAVLMR